MHPSDRGCLSVVARGWMPVALHVAHPDAGCGLAGTTAWYTPRPPDGIVARGGCGKGISAVCMFCRMPINQFTCLGGCRRPSESHADALQQLHVYEFAAGQSIISHVPRHPLSESCAPKSFALHGLRPPLQWCLAWGDPNFQNICTFVVYDKGSFGLYMYLACDVHVFEKNIGVKAFCQIPCGQKRKNSTGSLS